MTTSAELTTTPAIQVRKQLPKTPYGKDATRLIYNRFQVMKHRARKVCIPFAWDEFQDFCQDVVNVAAGTDYHPNTHRFIFDLGREGPDGREMGYCRETMSFTPIVANQTKKAETAKRTAAAPGWDRVAQTPDVQPLDTVRLASELTFLLAEGRGGSFSYLARCAAENCGVELNFT